LSDDVDTAIRQAFTISKARSFDRDPRFGLVVLTEVALRALSPALNDHGTAIDVIGRQVRLLDEWGRNWETAKSAPPKYPRVAVQALHHDDLVEDAFNLIARDGAGQVDIMLRLVKALRTLSETGPEPLRTAARHQLAIALERAASALGNADDRKRLEALAGRGLD
jgi:uncharacterized membrane protein